MPKFKVGDEVVVKKVIYNSDSDGIIRNKNKYIGKTFKVTNNDAHYAPLLYHLSTDDGTDWAEDELQLKTTNMNLNAMMKKLLDADTQTLIKAGYINGDLKLTDKGKEAMDTLNFLTNKVELVKLAQQELDENKE